MDSHLQDTVLERAGPATNATDSMTVGDPTLLQPSFTFKTVVEIHLFAGRHPPSTPLLRSFLSLLCLVPPSQSYHPR